MYERVFQCLYILDLYYMLIFYPLPQRHHRILTFKMPEIPQRQKSINLALNPDLALLYNWVILGTFFKPSGTWFPQLYKMCVCVCVCVSTNLQKDYYKNYPLFFYNAYFYSVNQFMCDCYTGNYDSIIQKSCWFIDFFPSL